MPRNTDDRAFLLTLADALDTRPAILRRDEYDTWRIEGSRGHIYGIPEAGAYYVAVMVNSARIWNNAKAILGFGRVTQDGDDEGIVRFEGLPTREQAKVIRNVIRLPKRKRLSPEQKAQLSAVGRKFQSRGTKAA